MRTWPSRSTARPRRSAPRFTGADELLATGGIRNVAGQRRSDDLVADLIA
ncbi:hypothetical protein [Citricoccus alkalitolerans]|uniref:Uncharacterized protein n=1 Tax=Citricoccus alkalitolerans TaxID=246603 RepID=A0ABV8XWK8_9MICC